MDVDDRNWAIIQDVVTSGDRVKFIQAKAECMALSRAVTNFMAHPGEDKKQALIDAAADMTIAVRRLAIQVSVAGVAAAVRTRVEVLMQKNRAHELERAEACRNNRKSTDG